MNEQQIYEKLNSIFSDYFKRDGFDLKPQTVATDIPGWDSMSHVQIIITVEKQMQLRFKHSEIANFDNVGDMVAAILKRKGTE